MSGILDPGDQRIIARALNSVDDPAPGVPLSSSQASGSIIQPYYGMVGKRLVCTAAMAAKLSDTTIATLYEGIYQYVQFKSGSTATPARGALVYWYDFENYIITPDVSATSNFGGDNSGLIAGVILNSVTKGNYGFIQIAGKAGVLFTTPITKTTPVQGDFVTANSTTTNKADVLADATGLTGPTMKRALGVSIETPVANAIKLVDLWNLRQVMGGLGGF